jgi:hypothetical protein
MSYNREKTALMYAYNNKPEFYMHQLDESDQELQDVTGGKFPWNVIEMRKKNQCLHDLFENIKKYSLKSLKTIENRLQTILKNERRL